MKAAAQIRHRLLQNRIFLRLADDSQCLFQRDVRFQQRNQTIREFNDIQLRPEQLSTALRRLCALPQKLQRHQATTLYTTGRIRLRIAFDQQFANASGGVTYFELE